MIENISIDICICTFQRTHIVTTLRSLINLQTLPNIQVRIIVVDNDDTPSAAESVQHMAAILPFPLMYFHAPARNISVARNACLDSSTAHYIAFIDDDELASPHWLLELLETLQKTNSTAVLGPVDALYRNDAPVWMKKGDFHATRPVWVNGKIISGYTCNLLLNRIAPQLENLRFREELGRSGGEDTVFLATLCARGGTISYADKALLHEPVPPSRASLLWLIKRRFRSGQTHGLLLLERHNDTPLQHMKKIALAAAKIGACFIMAIFCILQPVKAIGWILRGSIHIGVVARLIGKKELIQYG